MSASLERLELLLSRADVSDVVNRYATGIDSRDWGLFRTCFDDHIELDFTSWSGGEPRRTPTDDWVAGVRNGLSGFDATQHLSSNHIHTIEGDNAECVSYMVALHHLVEEGERKMHAIGGYYTNRLRRNDGEWRICACKLTVRWEMGDRGLFQKAQARWRAVHSD